MGRIRGYLAMSLDGFIAAPDDDVAWLEKPRTSGLPLATGEWAATSPTALEFDEFMAQVGCILMGRRTYDVVRAFGGPWPYGDVPMLVATSRELPDAPTSVTAASGPIAGLVEQARVIAGDRDVYVDGGQTIRATLDAGLVDHIVVTMAPTALGAGIPLFAGLTQRTDFSVEKVARWGDGMVQVHLTTRAERP